jgi:hypothetical protein
MTCHWAAWFIFFSFKGPRPLKLEEKKNVFSVFMTFDVVRLGNVATAAK